MKTHIIHITFSIKKVVSIATSVTAELSTQSVSVRDAVGQISTNQHLIPAADTPSRLQKLQLGESTESLILLPASDPGSSVQDPGCKLQVIRSRVDKPGIQVL